MSEFQIKKKKAGVPWVSYTAKIKKKNLDNKTATAEVNYNEGFQKTNTQGSWSQQSIQNWTLLNLHAKVMEDT